MGWRTIQPIRKAERFLAAVFTGFNTVEGNTTFYGLPKTETVIKWKDDTPPDFKFSFKFPQIISHTRMLVNCGAETRDFFERLAPLGERLGVFFLQLPPSFNKSALDVLEKYLSGLPDEFQYAVEVRHLDFFDEGDTEKRYNDMLNKHQINRVIFDTSTLHDIQSSASDIIAAQRKKPKMPSRFTVTADEPLIRYVGFNEAFPNETRLAEIADIVADWLQQNKTPYVFIHAPNDFYAPQLCRKFHEILSAGLPERSISPMPEWPSESKDNSGQLNLFDI